MKVSEVIRRAAKLLKEKGWIQYWFKDQNGCLCASAAIEEACDGSNSANVGYRRSALAQDAWHEVSDNVGGSVAAWNDMRGRTADEVILRLNEIADLAAAQGR